VAGALSARELTAGSWGIVMLMQCSHISEHKHYWTRTNADERGHRIIITIGRTQNTEFSSFVGDFSPCGAKNHYRRRKVPRCRRLNCCVVDNNF
jgi:hypothetical protein